MKGPREVEKVNQVGCVPSLQDNVFLGARRLVRPLLAWPPIAMAERYVVLAVVRRCAWYLKYASSELRADREVVMAAVTNNGHALKHASYALRADREVVLAAVEHDAACLRYASHALQCSIVTCWLWSSVVPNCSSIQSMLQHVPAELPADVQGVNLLRQPKIYLCDRTEWDKWGSHVAMECSLTRDRDALGAAVGVRTIPAPHAALNGASEALAIVHCLVARRVEALAAAGRFINVCPRPGNSGLRFDIVITTGHDSTRSILYFTEAAEKFTLAELLYV